MRRRVFAWLMTLVVALSFGMIAGCAGDDTKDLGGAAGVQAATPQDDAGPVDATAEESAEGLVSPVDAAGLQTWLGKVYPDAAWLSRIKEIQHVPGEVPDSGGFKNAVVVTTDLDFESEQALAIELQSALGEANLAWAKQHVIKFGDGRNIMAGDLVDLTP